MKTNENTKELSQNHIICIKSIEHKINALTKELKDLKFSLLNRIKYNEPSLGRSCQQKNDMLNESKNCIAIVKALTEELNEEITRYEDL